MSLPGYHAAAYANSFRQFGDVVTLPNSGLRLIRRRIADGLFDYSGLYPFSVCRDWSLIEGDLAQLRSEGAVSLVMVTDPFDGPSASQALSGWTLCRPFKTHLVVDLRQDWRDQLGRNPKRYARKAFHSHDVEVLRPGREHAKDFWTLYKTLISRHGISGIQRLSYQAIERQLAVEGVTFFAARVAGSIAGALICITCGDRSYFHLLGLSAEAYQLHTNYALTYKALDEADKRGASLVSLGGAAGFADDPRDGLFLFKKRWANTTRESLICGTVLNTERYEMLNNQAGIVDASPFFPAYRMPGGPFEWPGR